MAGNENDTWLVTGSYYGTTLGHYVYHDEQNQFTAMPVDRDPTAHIAGWEGAGPQPADAAPVLSHREEVELRHSQMLKEIAAESVSLALGALHGQRRADGRPQAFIPEID